MSRPSPPSSNHQFGGLHTIAGKVAYVPGGAGGLGEAIAWGLAAIGARVVIGDMMRQRSRAWSAALRDKGHEARAWPSTRARSQTSVARSTRSAITSGGAISSSTAWASTASRRSSR